MTGRNFFTQQELDEARSKLENLPDLTPQRITRAGALENLRETILMLAKEKGYTASDIKAVLDNMKFRFSEKSISAVINEDGGKKKRQVRRQEPVQIKSPSTDEKTG